MEVEVLVGELSSSDSEARERARERLGALGPDAVEPLLAGLARDERDARRLRRAALLLGVSAIALLGGLALLAACYPWLIAALPFLLWAALMYGWSRYCDPYVGRLAKALQAYRRARAGQRYVVGMLGRVGDLRAVGAVLRAAQTQDRAFRERLWAGVAPVLRRAKASDTGLVGPEDRQSMYRELGRATTDPAVAALQVAILQALQQIGTGEALASVEHLAGHPALRRSERVVKDAALASLEVLRARAEREGAVRTLLRPADGPEEPTLLRPAQGAPEAPAEQLLRPASTSRDEQA